MEIEVATRLHMLVFVVLYRCLSICLLIDITYVLGMNEIIFNSKVEVES